MAESVTVSDIVNTAIGLCLSTRIGCIRGCVTTGEQGTRQKRRSVLQTRQDSHSEEGSYTCLPIDVMVRYSRVFNGRRLGKKDLTIEENATTNTFAHCLAIYVV